VGNDHFVIPLVDHYFDISAIIWAFATHGFFCGVSIENELAQISVFRTYPFIAPHSFGSTGKSHFVCSRDGKACGKRAYG
jgi:hypothetical protein